MNFPPIAERRRPGLCDTLTGPRSPTECQSCGSTAEFLQRWEECNELDQRTARVVVLCAPCAKRLIEPHPRLYHQLATNEPHAGSMAHLCGPCAHRDGVTCRCPLLKANGGPGMMITYPKPESMFLCGRGAGSGFRQVFSRPVTSCAGQHLRTASAFDEPVDRGRLIDDFDAGEAPK